MSAVSDERPVPADTVRSAFAPVATALSETLRSAWPDGETMWLTAAELRTARSSLRYASPILAAAALVIAQCFAPWVSWGWRAAWSLSVVVAAVVLKIVANRLEARPIDTLAALRFRAFWQVGFTLVFLTAWCSMSVFLWAPGAVFTHMLLALILAASLAGSITSSSIHPATAFSVVGVHAVFLITPLALSKEPTDHTLAWLAGCFVATMAIQSVVLHRSHRKLLELEHEHSGLVEGLRAAKQESDRDRARAAAAGKTKSQFLSNMNHELRTPMNAILGFSELIKHKAFGEAVDKYAEYAEIIHQSGLNLLRLIDDMLDLAKIEGGRLSLRESEFSLSDVFADIFHDNEARANDAQLSFVRKIAPALPCVFADERAVRHIMINLVSNALKFTPAGGCVTLFARLEDDGRIAFGVDDTGIGIAEADQAKVFERFGAGRHDVTTADKGTGLGLAIVKGFAEAHDGAVALESAQGAGTRVTAWLPAERVRPLAMKRAG